MQLSTYLQAHNLTYEKFGALLNVAPISIYRYVKGKRFPTHEVLAKIKNLTDGQVTYEDFPLKKRAKKLKSINKSHNIRKPSCQAQS